MELSLTVVHSHSHTPPLPCPPLRRSRGQPASHPRGPLFTHAPYHLDLMCVARTSGGSAAPTRAPITRTYTRRRPKVCGACFLAGGSHDVGAQTHADSSRQPRCWPAVRMSCRRRCAPPPCFCPRRSALVRHEGFKVEAQAGRAGEQAKHARRTAEVNKRFGPHLSGVLRLSVLCAAAAAPGVCVVRVCMCVCVCAL